MRRMAMAVDAVGGDRHQWSARKGHGKSFDHDALRCKKGKGWSGLLAV
jgi:hypothetical protein